MADRPWTKGASFPGGDFAGGDFPHFLQDMVNRYGWVPPELLARWARSYGTRLLQVIGDARAIKDLGQEVVPGLYEAEIAYLRRAEWAETAEDILWRRSKLGLHAGAGAAETLEAYLKRV